MKGDIVTLYHPGDGVTAESNSTTYKGIKDFAVNQQRGTITFATKKHGVIETPLPWRLKKGVELGEEDQAAGNMAKKPGNNWD